MTVNGPGGGGTCKASVNFNPPMCTLVASPSGVFSGETSRLLWTLSYATAATITDGTTPIMLTPTEIAAKSGTKTTPPITGSITYNMSITGPGGNATCGPITIETIVPPIGGLIPCGRLADNPKTDDIDESEPCNLCAMFYLLKNIVNFIMTLSIGIGVFILIMSGLFYALSAGNSRTIDQAKTAATSAIIGIAIISVGWLVIAIILQGLGYANIATWNQISCILPT